MSYVRRAVIDVGTNSVKLLVAEVAGRDVRPLWEDSRQTRLGAGFYETHQLQPAAIAKTAAVVADFVETARAEMAGTIRVIATSAAREAVNPQELISAIESEAGLKVEIISGEREADWAFQGVTTEPALASVSLLLLDVGGGSTEFILGHGEHQHFRQSFPLGTLRMLERNRPSDPPTAAELAACRSGLRDFLETTVRPQLAPALRREEELHAAHQSVILVGTGGTTSILARLEKELTEFNRDAIEATRLSRDRLRWHTERLWRLPLAERKQIIGMPPKRADVILMGAAIYEAVLETFGFGELRVSTRGLRFAALMDQASNRLTATTGALPFIGPKAR